jgi:hypothetical protein
MMLAIAHLLLMKREVSLREVQLWIEHVGHCWASPKMREATINFHKALRDEGLSELTFEAILCRLFPSLNDCCLFDCRGLAVPTPYVTSTRRRAKPELLVSSARVSLPRHRLSVKLPQTRE